MPEPVSSNICSAYGPYNPFKRDVKDTLQTNNCKPGEWTIIIGEESVEMRQFIGALRTTESNPYSTRTIDLDFRVTSKQIEMSELNGGYMRDLSLVKQTTIDKQSQGAAYFHKINELIDILSTLKSGQPGIYTVNDGRVPNRLTTEQKAFLQAAIVRLQTISQAK
ncbi:MAG: hypothetical protein MUC35_02170 [Candidatus Margulisbacteria bacterium]|jgi:hypothetical protein|nr:hypothetical protein [Candidatus Margulisiibacteriota bacterium]